MFLIAPSILSADMTKLGDEVHAVMNAGADLIHLDIMDNHYVPNLTFGPWICSGLRNRFPDLKMDVHLMTTHVDSLIVDFARAGATRISIHPDTTIHLDRSLDLIRQQGCEPGLVLNPTVSPECLHWCQHRLSFVLVMTVNPGFGGQVLIPEMLKKITWIKNQFPHLPICVDGGVTVDNIVDLAKAGVTQFVAGSAIFSTNHYDETITLMRSRLHSLCGV